MAAALGVVMLGLTALLYRGAGILTQSGLVWMVSFFPHHQKDILKSQTEPGERRPNLTPLNLDGATL